MKKFMVLMFTLLLVLLLVACSSANKVQVDELDLLNSRIIDLSAHVAEDW